MLIISGVEEFGPVAKVDIIVPAYNAALYLPFALDSVITQTFQDWRILLVDDGSTDGTQEIATRYRQQLAEKLLYIRKANGGLAAARNTAIQHSTAEFLALLDADDVWLPNRLDRSLAAFEGRPKVGLSYGFVDRIDSTGRYVDTFAPRKKKSDAEGRVARQIYTRKLELPCPTITFRRTCIDEIGLFDVTMRATEDRDLWLRIARRYEVAHVPEVIAQYRLSPQSMSTDPDRMSQSQQQFVDKHYKLSGCGWLARRVALSGIYRGRSEAMLSRGRLASAATDLLKAFHFNPFELANLRILAAVVKRSIRHAATSHSS